MFQLFLWIVMFPPYGNSILLYYFSIIWSYLLFSYAGDKLIGGPKFFPSILQNKTVSGVILGSSVSFLTACILFKYLLNYNEQQHRIEAAIAIIILILHELIYSKIKQVLCTEENSKTFVLDNFGYFISVTYTGIIYAIVTIVLPFIWRKLCHMMF